MLTARDGDVLVLGKPLGVGVLSAALEKRRARCVAGYAEMLRHTTQLNRVGMALAQIDGVHAMTDVTGFGLAGHLLEICRGSQLSAQVDLERAAAHCKCCAVGPGGRVHGRLGPQLGGLRHRRGLARNGTRLATNPADRSADQRRAAAPSWAASEQPTAGATGPRLARRSSCAPHRSGQSRFTLRARAQVAQRRVLHGVRNQVDAGFAALCKRLQCG
jgi:hypothetical protein